MPYKKRAYRKKKKTYKKRRPTRSSPLMVNISRATNEVIELKDGNAGWTGYPALVPTMIGKSFQFTLNDVSDLSDFTNLFAFYRINSVNVKIYLSNTNSTVGKNAQVLCRYDSNRLGVGDEAANEQIYLDSQTARTKLCLTTMGKPISFLMKLKIAAEVYAGAVNTDYVIKNPTWISTTETSTPHFGLKLMFQRVDGLGFSSGSTVYQTARIEYRYNMSFKKIQ